MGVDTTGANQKLTSVTVLDEKAAIDFDTALKNLETYANNLMKQAPSFTNEKTGLTIDVPDGFVEDPDGETAYYTINATFEQLQNRTSLVSIAAIP